MLNVDEFRNRILEGDSYTILKQFPSSCIDLVVTSPPYYNLRDYKHKDQIGTETTPQQYINKLFNVFKECKRVLKKHGSIWVNIADSYDENKSLFGIPERFIIAMQDGLHLVRRNTIIWHKPSCMPSSVKDRFTVDFEYFYWFVKDADSYDFETQYEPMKTPVELELNRVKEYKGTAQKDYTGNKVQDPSDMKRRIIENWKKKAPFGGSKETGKYASNQDSVTNKTYSGNNWIPNANLERIKRTVWSINTGNSTESHYASYPEELIEIPIKACTRKEVAHNISLVLDPFVGSGTTCIKAQKMKRSFVGIDLNHEYVTIANRRLNNMITSYISRT